MLYWLLVGVNATECVARKLTSCELTQSPSCIPISIYIRTHIQVGHTLGLRHNFRGSTAVPFDKLSDATYVEAHGLTSSVMDYLPLNLRSSKAPGMKADANKNTAAATSKLSAKLLFPTFVGDYDIAAIRYGYTPFVKQTRRLSDVHNTPQQQQQQQAGRSPRCFNDFAEVPVAGSNIYSIATNAPPFATDEHVGGSSGPDPLTSVFDLSATPLAYYKDQLVLASELRAHLGRVAASLQWDEPGISERVIMRMVRNAAVYTTKFVGGASLLRTSPNPREPVELEVQWEALRVLVGVLVGKGPNGEQLFPTASSLSWWTSSDGKCAGVQQYCLGTKPLDPWSQVTQVQLEVLKGIFQPDRMERLLAQYEWRQDATKQGSSGGKGGSGDGSPSGRDEEKKELLPSSVVAAVADAIFGASMENVNTLSARRSWPLHLEFVKLMASYCDRGKGSSSAASGEEAVSVSTLAQLCAVGAGQLDLIKSSALRPGYAAPMAVRGHVAALKRLITRFDRGD
jgi:hypothetical protein